MNNSVFQDITTSALDALETSGLGLAWPFSSRPFTHCSQSGAELIIKLSRFQPPTQITHGKKKKDLFEPQFLGAKSQRC